MTAVGGIYCFRFLRKFSPLTFWGQSSRGSIFLFLLGNSLSLIYLPFKVSFSVSLGHRPCSTLSSSQSFICQSIRYQNVFSWLLYSHLCAPPHSRGKSGYKTCTKSRSHVVSLVDGETLEARFIVTSPFGSDSLYSTLRANAVFSNRARYIKKSI